MASFSSSLSINSIPALLIPINQPILYSGHSFLYFFKKRPRKWQRSSNRCIPWDQTRRVEPKVTSSVQSQELRRKKRIKYIAYFAAFAVFQTIVILIFAFTVMRVKTPKFRLRSVEIESLAYTSSAASPSFNIRFNAQVAVKNTNFGNYKFDNTTIQLSYNGLAVGEATIAKARARFLSTKKMDVTIDVTSDNAQGNSNLATDLNSGFLTLTSHGKLNGKVELMMIMKKKKSAQMNCTINVDLANKVVKDLKC